ncbi:hypothetical protein RUND412_002352 [Rhizina undulata]
MVDPMGTPLGVIGVIQPLVTAFIKGYAIFKTTQSIGEDWGDLERRYKRLVEKFKDWEKEMGDGLSACREKDGGNYELLYELLEKIEESFRKIEEIKSIYDAPTDHFKLIHDTKECFHKTDHFKPTYEPKPGIVRARRLPTDLGSFNSKGDGQRYRKKPGVTPLRSHQASELLHRFSINRDLSTAYRPFSVSLAVSAAPELPVFRHRGPIVDTPTVNHPFGIPLAIPAVPSISTSSCSNGKVTRENHLPPSVKMSETIPGLDQKDDSSVQRAAKKFRENEKTFQNAIPTGHKIRWAVSDKERLTIAVDELEKYSDRLLDITKDLKKFGGSSTSNTPTIPGVPFQGTSTTTATISPEFRVPVSLPFRRNPKFCGREDIFEKLFQLLEPKENIRSRRKTIVLYGLGGAGKSQIALEYAHLCACDYSSIFWIDADDVSRTADSAHKAVEQLVCHYVRTHYQNKPSHSLAADYHEISKKLGIPGCIDGSGRMNQGSMEVALAAVHTWLLTEENRRWLLIIDNNDRARLGKLDELIPTCDWGTVIIITRLPNLERFGDCIEVEGIGADAGLELLLKSSGRYHYPVKPDESELVEAREIVQELGQLPLALDQAAAYISSLQISFSDYRQKLKKGLKAGFDTELPEPGLPSYKTSVLTTWKLSFEELSDDARQLFHLCAFLNNEDIPDELFRRGKSAVDWLKEEKAMSSLSNLSLAKRKKSNDSFWIHTLVQAWAREHPDITTQRQNAENTITLVANAIISEEHKRSPDNWIFLRRILSHLKVCEDHISEYFSDLRSVKAAAALSTIGSTYEKLGNYNKAEDFYRRAHTGYEKTMGKDDPRTLDTAHNLASIFNDQCRHIEALEWYCGCITQ